MTRLRLLYLVVIVNAILAGAVEDFVALAVVAALVIQVWVYG